MRHKALVTAIAAITLLTLSAAPANAVTDGVPDEDGHPYVGLMVAIDEDGNPLWRCSGTLISSTVFVTAGHCTDEPAVTAEIWFQSDLEPVPADFGYPTEGVDGGIGQQLNRVPKYVASRSTLTPEWAGTTQLGPDAAADVAALRERHENIHIIGSIDFVQTLLAEKAFDELVLWVYPIVLGQGKKVFPDGAAPANLRLLAPPVAGSSGAVSLRYGPAEGTPQTGDMTTED